jgi:hypothetical protein
VHFSGGTTAKGGFIGTSTTITLSVRAKKSGVAKIYFEDAQVYGSDGKGDLLDNETHAITITVPETGPTPVASGAATAPVPTALAPKSSPLPRSADFNGDGKVTLIDMSILVLHMFGSYDPRYDLDMDGSVNITDLSILLSRMGGTN